MLCRVNAELLDDVPSFASTLDGILSASIAVKLDYAGLYGTGTSSQRAIAERKPDYACLVTAHGKHLRENRNRHRIG